MVLWWKTRPGLVWDRPLFFTVPPEIIHSFYLIISAYRPEIKKFFCIFMLLGRRLIRVNLAFAADNTSNGTYE
jgi:hypothetical protein